MEAEYGKNYNSFHLSTKGAQHQFTGNLHWFTLALQVTLHHPSYKSWGKTEQEVTFEQYQSLMCRSWKQAHDFYVSSSVSKVILRNNISEK